MNKPGLEYSFDASHSDEIESHVSIRFQNVITLPVLWKGKGTGIVVYVGSLDLGVGPDMEGLEPLPPTPGIGSILDVVGRLDLVKEKP